MIKNWNLNLSYFCFAFFFSVFTDMKKISLFAIPTLRTILFGKVCWLTFPTVVKSLLYVLRGNRYFRDPIGTALNL